MITQTLTTSFKTELLQGIHDFSTDTFKIALYYSTASLGADTTIYDPLTTGEVSGTGYVSGGETLTVNPTPTSSGTIAYVSFDPAIWTGASFTTAGALIYNVSKSDKSVAVLNFGNDKTASGTFTVTFPSATSTTAIIRIA